MDEAKTREQLLEELVTLRQKLAELQKLEHGHRGVTDILRGTELQYHFLLESVNDAIYVLNRDWRFVIVNNELERILQIPKEKLLSSKLTDLFPGIENTLLYKEFQHVMESRIPEVVTDESFFAKGQRGCYEVHIYPVLEGIMCVSVDITERKKSKEVLKVSEMKYQTLVDRLQSGAYQSDLNGNYTTLNQAGAKILGFDSPQQIIGKWKTVDLYYDLSKRAEMVDAIRRTGSWMGEVQAKRLDGTVIWLQANNNAMQDAQGNIVGYEGVFSDITESKKAEESLLESEARYRNLFEGSRDAIFITSREGQFVDCNQSFLDLFGYTREELAGLNTKQLYVNPGDRQKYQEEIEQKGGVKDYEVKFHKKDGTEIDCLLAATLRLGKDGGILGYQGSIRDITRRKKVGEELVEKSRELENKLMQLEGVNNLTIRLLNERIELIRKLERRLDQFAQIHLIAETICSATSLDECFKTIVSFPSKVVKSDFTSIVLVMEDGSIVRSAESHGMKAPWLYRTYPGGTLQNIIDSGKLLYIPNYTTDPKRFQLVVAQGVKSWVGIPLIIDEKVRGIFIARSLQDNAFADDIEVLEAFADWVTIALRNLKYAYIPTGDALR